MCLGSLAALESFTGKAVAGVFEIFDMPSSKYIEVLIGKEQRHLRLQLMLEKSVDRMHWRFIIAYLKVGPFAQWVTSLQMPSQISIKLLGDI